MVQVQIRKQDDGHCNTAVSSVSLVLNRKNQFYLEKSVLYYKVVVVTQLQHSC